ncbi:MAG: bifunctional diaminohydroxyphosphoribosylaminopyrimidine deaminase/5-amino-6-(5-phosphoribosylamino)uracil reductase RibD, partial [Pseudomonadales bacterium]
KAGVKRVVAAMPDPDPRNDGAGFALLKEAGIEVATGVMADEAAALNPGHIKLHKEGMPFVRLKLAMSLDGRTALPNGESRWITSEASRADVQLLRAGASALVTGVQTVLDDDPQLRVRDHLSALPHPEETLAVQREVFVLDSNGLTPPDARILSLPGTVVVTGKHARPPKNAQHLECKIGKDGRISLPHFFGALAGREHSEVLLECGATLAGAAMTAGLVDELIIYIAPRFMGAAAKPLLKLPDIVRMSGLVETAITDVQRIGPDIKVTAIPATQKP